MIGASISLLRLVLLALVSLVLTTADASAQYCTPDQCDECNLCQCNSSCCHELPELWLVNTRCAPRCQNLDSGFDRITFKRYDRQCGRWVQESVESFLAEEATMPTLFYAHGNSLSHKFAMKSCWLIYNKMRCCPGSKRLVFWSWPSERVHKTEGLRVRKMIEKNLRTKYIYAEYQGYYLAKLVDRMSLSQRVMLSGHSYGGITSAAAVHYLGGGCLRGLTLAGGAEFERPNLRAAIISGAFDHDMLIPGHRYGQAFVAGEKILVTRNINDRTLKKWPKTSWTGRRAIGVVGVNANLLGEFRSKLCQQTMSADVGTSHYLKPHLKSARFVSALCCLSFPACQQPSRLAIVESPAEAELLSEVICDEQLATEAGRILANNNGPKYDHSEYDHSEYDSLSLLRVRENTLPARAGQVRVGGFIPDDNSAAFVEFNSLLFQPIEKQQALEEQQAKPSQKTARAVTVCPSPPEQLQRAGHLGSIQTPFRYRLGLILAIVLMGQLYVVLSNRSTSA